MPERTEKNHVKLQLRYPISGPEREPMASLTEVRVLTTQSQHSVLPYSVTVCKQ
jgi:hypothetical protein